MFNDIGKKEKQDTFLAGLITVNNIVRRRPITNEKPNRSFACVYKVRIDGTNEIIVCKNAFCSLFGVGKAVVERLSSNIKQNNPSPKDLRGKHANRPSKISDQILFQIKTHIQSFPRLISHYSRHDNNEKRFLSPELSISKMYKLYLEKHEQDILEKLKNGEKVKPIVKYEFFSDYFNKKFNLSFGNPKSDTCQTCDRLQNLINAEIDQEIKLSLIEEKEMH